MTSGTVLFDVGDGSFATLVTISRPSAYEEYEPYRFGKSEVELSITIYILQRVQIQGLIDWNNHLQFSKNPLGTLGNNIPRNKKLGSLDL